MQAHRSLCCRMTRLQLPWMPLRTTCHGISKQPQGRFSSWATSRGFSPRQVTPNPSGVPQRCPGVARGSRPPTTHSSWSSEGNPGCNMYCALHGRGDINTYTSKLMKQMMDHYEMVISTPLFHNREWCRSSAEAGTRGCSASTATQGSLASQGS